MCGKYTSFPCKNHVRHTFGNFSVCLNTWVKGIFKYTVYTRKKKQVGTVKTNTDEKQRVRSLGFAERNHGNLILDTHLSCRRGLVKSPAFLLARSLHFYRLVEKNYSYVLVCKNLQKHHCSNKTSQEWWRADTSWNKRYIRFNVLWTSFTDTPCSIWMWMYSSFK